MFSHNWPNTDTGLSLRRSELFTVSRQVAPLNCAPGTKSAIIDCLVNFLDSLFLCLEDRLTAANATDSKLLPKDGVLGALTPFEFWIPCPIVETREAIRIGSSDSARRSHCVI